MSVSISYNELLSKRVCVKYMIVKRVCLLALNIRQGRREGEVDSILEPQLKNGFKLENLILEIVPNFVLTYMT